MLLRCEDKKLVWSSKIDNIEIAILGKLAEKDGGPNSFGRIQRTVHTIKLKKCKVIWSVLVNERNEWSSGHIEKIHFE